MPETKNADLKSLAEGQKNHTKVKLAELIVWRDSLRSKINRNEDELCFKAVRKPGKKVSDLDIHSIFRLLDELYFKLVSVSTTINSISENIKLPNGKSLFSNMLDLESLKNKKEILVRFINELRHADGEPLVDRRCL